MFGNAVANATVPNDYVLPGRKFAFDQKILQNFEFINSFWIETQTWNCENLVRDLPVRF